MVEVTTEYQGQLHTRIQHGPSADVLETDAPTDNQGKGERFSPTDLVSAALSSCILTVMGILADRHGWPLAGTTATTRKHMADDPPRRIGRLEVELHFSPGIPAEARQPLLRAAETCPVSHSLHPDLGVELTAHWPA